MHPSGSKPLENPSQRHFWSVASHKADLKTPFLLRTICPLFSAPPWQFRPPLLMAFPAGCEGLHSRNVTVKSKGLSRGGSRQHLGRQVLRLALPSEEAHRGGGEGELCISTLPSVTPTLDGSRIALKKKTTLCSSNLPDLRRTCTVAIRMALDCVIC